MIRTSVRLLLVCCTAALACGEGLTSPGFLASGTYVLDRYNAAQVPALWVAGSTDDLFLETDTLRMSPHGAARFGSRIMSRRRVGGGSGEVTFLNFGGDEYVFSFVGQEIRFVRANPFVCPDCDYYLEDYRGTITPTGIDVRDRSAVGDRVFSFRRVE
jgi:hypothetical protein